MVRVFAILRDAPKCGMDDAMNHSGNHIPIRASVDVLERDADKAICDDAIGAAGDVPGLHGHWRLLDRTAWSTCASLTSRCSPCWRRVFA